MRTVCVLCPHLMETFYVFVRLTMALGKIDNYIQRDIILFYDKG